MEKRHKMRKIKIKMKNTISNFLFHFWASLILRTVPTKFEGNRIIILPSTRKMCPRLMQLPVSSDCLNCHILGLDLNFKVAILFFKVSTLI